MDCQDKIYSEEYEDYIVEYGSWSELVSEQYQTDCYQLADFRFAVVYLEGSAVDESRRNAELVIPRCFGLLSSTQTLEETGALSGEMQRRRRKKPPASENRDRGLVMQW